MLVKIDLGLLVIHFFEFLFQLHLFFPGVAEIFKILEVVKIRAGVELF